MIRNCAQFYLTKNGSLSYDLIVALQEFIFILSKPIRFIQNAETAIYLFTVFCRLFDLDHLNNFLLDKMIILVFCCVLCKPLVTFLTTDWPDLADKGRGQGRQGDMLLLYSVHSNGSKLTERYVGNLLLAKISVISGRSFFYCQLGRYQYLFPKKVI